MANSDYAGALAIAKLSEQRLRIPINKLKRLEVSDTHGTAVKEALLTFPLQSKDAFDTANKESSFVVATESIPRDFVKRCNGDSKRAAERLATYWKYRKSLFGPTYRKQLTSTGAGALSSGDIEVLNSGFLVILPADEANRTVVCYDRSRLEEDFDEVGDLLNSMTRCAFYMLSVLLEDEAALATGFQFIMLENTPANFTPLPIDESFRRELRHLIEQVLPIKLVHTHFVFKFPRIGKDEFKTGNYDKAVKIIESIHEQGSYTIHRGSKKNGICEILKRVGLRKDGLPASIGGDWKYFEQFMLWKRERNIIERLVEAALKGGESGRIDSLDIVNQADAKTKKRAKDVLYARRKREQVKSEANTLTRAIMKLQEEKRMLLETQASLSGMLSRARATIQADLMLHGHHQMGVLSHEHPLLVNQLKRNFPLGVMSALDPLLPSLTGNTSLGSALALAGHLQLHPMDLYERSSSYPLNVSSPRITNNLYSLQSSASGQLGAPGTGLLGSSIGSTSLHPQHLLVGASLPAPNAATQEQQNLLHLHNPSATQPPLGIGNNGILNMNGYFTEPPVDPLRFSAKKRQHDAENFAKKSS